MPLAAILAALTVLVLAVLIRPLLRRPRPVADLAGFDRAVYRDQLQELERDVGRGLMGAEEARAAALEIQRRLLATDQLQRTAPPPGRSPALALGISLLIAAGAGSLYLRLGSPALPDLPFATRVLPPPETATARADTSAHTDTRQAAERLAAKLKANPANGEGWLLYARTEAMLNDWDGATDAYRHAIALGQVDGDVYAGFGEMLVMAAQGIVSPAAHDAFAASVKADPGNDVARFYLALADAQAGETDKAITAWRSLAGQLDADSPIRAEIARRIGEAAQQAGIKAPDLPPARAAAPPSAAPGPTPEQMAAAEKMSPEERDRMVETMTARLAAQLQANPNDVEGWLRLGRAYAVQNKPDQAADAFTAAARLRPDDADIKLQAVAALLAPVKPDAPLPARAVALLQDVATLRPAAPEVLWYLGVVAARDGRKEEARRNWTQLLQALPSESEDTKMVRAALNVLDGP